LRVINGQRGKLALFKLDDKSAVIEAGADEALLNAQQEPAEGRCPDHRQGHGAKRTASRVACSLKVSQIWDLEQARCRFGKFLRVAVNGHAPDISRLVKEFPARREMTEQGELLRGLPVRLSVERQHAAVCARAELQLGDEARFFPSDAALASWSAQAAQGQAVIVYD
jgi:DNA polymerase-3 subunit alpha